MRTEDQGVLVDRGSGVRVAFSLNPVSFQDGKTTELASIGVPGMSHPKVQFTGGGERVLGFSISLHYGADKDVEGTIRTLQSWQYPEYSGTRLTKPPARLLLIFGQTWPNEQWAMRSCTVTRRRFDKTLKCVGAEVALELVQIITTSIDAREVRA